MREILATALLLPSISFAAHPLVTDDTGTQGSGGIQLELNVDATRVESGGSTDHNKLANATFTYGLQDNLDIAFNAPHQRTAVTGSSVERGIADASLALKWRFWENEGFSLGLKPQLLFATGDEQRGLGNGKASFGTNLLASFEGEAFGILANAGYTYNNNAIGSRKNLWNISAAMLWKFDPKLKAVLDVGTSRNLDPSNNDHPAFAIIGIIYSPTEKLDLDIGFRKGLKDAQGEKTAGMGITMRW